MGDAAAWHAFALVITSLLKILPQDGGRALAAAMA
jgi:hypothetical protein